MRLLARMCKGQWAEAGVGTRPKILPMGGVWRWHSGKALPIVRGHSGTRPKILPKALCLPGSTKSPKGDPLMIKQGLFTRDACSQDMPLCARIWYAEKQRFPWPEAGEIHDFYQHIEGETLFVAEYSGTVAGFISVYAPDSFVHHLFVHQEYSRLGIGSALLTHVVERFPKPMTLKCVIWNRSACVFYQRNGWKKTTTCEYENPPYHVFSLS